VALIQTMTFRLATDAADRDFLAADRRAQTEFFYSQPGIVRRTTGRGQDGEWIVIALWGSAGDADAAANAARSHPAIKQFEATVDAGSLVMKTYETLD
jgi:hypothetical protein